MRTAQTGSPAIHEPAVPVEDVDSKRGLGQHSDTAIPQNGHTVRPRTKTSVVTGRDGSPGYLKVRRCKAHL